MGKVWFLTLTPSLWGSLGYLHHLRRDKMSDRETLLSMGFDPARVDCESFLLEFAYRIHDQTSVLPFFWGISYVGALKATGSRGLQPAMDHLVENEGNPVPDLSSVVSSSTQQPSGGDPMDEDEDLYGPGPGDADAKV